jgi:GT2 family glycosyltransferase
MGPPPGGKPDPADAPVDIEALDEPGLRSYLAVSRATIEELLARVEGEEWLASKIAEQAAELDRLEGERERQTTELASLRADRLVRYGAVLRRLSERRRARSAVQSTSVPDGVGTGLVDPPPSLPEDHRYPTWVAAFDTIDDDARQIIRQRLDQVTDLPLVSVILPVFNTPEPYLREAIDSVRAQLYPHWELCIADDCSTAAWVPKVLEEYAALDPRIRVERREENGHISAASNTAVAMATGEWIAFFDHDDLLAEHALALAVLALADSPDAGALYSDEDLVDDDGVRSFPYFKPDFDPILLLGQNYFSHLCMLRRDLIVLAGGFRVGYEGSQDWDVVLRVVERLRSDQIVHVPHVLYHWRVHPGSTSSSLSAKPYAAIAARRAVTDHLHRVGQEARVLPAGWTGFNRIRWELSEAPPPVTVVILPRTGVRLTRCINSARARAAYPDVEVMVVDDGDRRPMLRAFMRDWRKTVTVVSDYRNVSDGALRNAAAGQASGEILCFLHDDVEAVSDGWLEEMVGLLLQPGIGAVGAKLLYPDETIHHAGIVMGIGGTAGYIHRRADRLDPGYGGRAMLSQSFSAVSWACMVVRREAFEAVGGFDEANLSGAYVDVDFCLRLGEAGWRVAWTPNAEMTRYASPTEPRESEGENAIRFAREIRYLHTRWAPVLAADPAYSPNLSLAHETMPLAWPPRASYR